MWLDADASAAVAMAQQLACHAWTVHLEESCLDGRLSAEQPEAIQGC